MALPSCTDLQSEMYDVINPTIFPMNEDDASALVTAAAYGPFRSNWYSGLFSSATGGVETITEMTTDIGDCQWNDPEWPDVLNVNFTANSSGVISFYSDYSNFIGKMTLCIDRIKDVEMNENTRTRFIAETRCGRGWLAYILYDLYGGIQVPSLELLQNPLSDEVAPRLSDAETVQFIEEDLKAAIPDLPASYRAGDSNYGRFTRGLAYTVLMKLYMHEKNWDKAIECGRELMKAEYGYSLMPEYADIFTLENEGNAEIIWAAVCSSAVNQQLWLAHVLSSQVPTNNPSIQKWGGYRVPWQFYDTFDKNDRRLKVLVGDFVGTDGVRYNEENPGTVLIKGAMPVNMARIPRPPAKRARSTG